MTLVKWLKDIEQNEKGVGNKAINLAYLLNVMGLNVPNGFVITSTLFEKYATGIGTKDDMLRISFTESDADLILKSYDLINGLVAVRSSMPGFEDLPEASFAGQFDSYLGVDKEDLISKVKACWSSLFNERVKAYATKKGLLQGKLSAAVIVQELIEAKCSGVVFTYHPAVESNELIINSSWGLGDPIVSGEINPDQFIVNKDGLKITSEKIYSKNEQCIYGGKGKGTEMVTVPKKLIREPSLTFEEIASLAGLAKIIESHYGQPVDIEFAIDGGGVIYLLQARPICKYRL